DVERLRGDLQLLARAREVDVPLLDGVRETAEAGDLDLDDLARTHWSRVRRRSGENDIPGLERDHPAEVGQLVRDAEEQVAGHRLLHHGTLHVQTGGGGR